MLFESKLLELQLVLIVVGFANWISRRKILAALLIAGLVLVVDIDILLRLNRIFIFFTAFWPTTVLLISWRVFVWIEYRIFVFFFFLLFLLY